MPAFGIDRSLSSNKFSALLLAVISEAGNQLLGGYAGIAQNPPEVPKAISLCMEL